MFGSWFTLALGTVFLCYITHSMWTIYQLYNPAPCSKSQSCLYPSWNKLTKHQLIICASSKSSIHSIRDLTPLWKSKDFNIFDDHEIKLDLELPRVTLRNGSYFLHTFLYGSTKEVRNLEELMTDPLTSYGGCALTKFQVAQASAFNLLSQTVNSNKKKMKKDPVSHLKPRLTIYGMSEPIALDRKNMPWEISSFLRLTEKKEFLPIIYTGDLSYRIKDLQVLNASEPKMAVSLVYSPISLGRMRLMVTVEQAIKTMHKLGFSEKDTDEVKGIFFDTNIYLLLVTCLVSALHLLFDLLAFKNDIKFWRERKSMVGVSLRTLMWRCASQTIVSLYLLDQSTSLLVLGPSFLAALIEIWKVGKATKVKVIFQGWRPALQFGSSTEEEKRTQGFDSEGMIYLCYLLYPLVIGGAIYSLFYTPHKSWYSWCIESLANGVYAFGFLFMLPQLFINYRLKSVAHLPWRAFTYKAFNTFIDDLFAFIISMPTAHRVACFRDDLVFLIYLYQRWLYPVDKGRVNEYGQSYNKPSKDEEKKEL